MNLQSKFERNMGYPIKKDFNPELLEELLRSGVKIRQNVAADLYNTFSVGGELSVFIDVDSLEELTTVVRSISKAHLGPIILGFGSNSIFPDGVFHLPVIKLSNKFRFFEQKQAGLFRVGASMSLMNLARKVSLLGFSGLEFAGGIPGSLGGAVRMNAGAHAGEISDVIHSVSYMTPGGECITLDKNELSFSYRKSSLPADAIIYEADLQLVSSSKERCFELLEENLSYRKSTQPLTLPSAGSTFRNVLVGGETVAAGKLIEDAGLKGERVGGAQVSLLHANWIVNPDKKATTADILALIALCKEKVLKNSGFDLQTEVVSFK